MKRVLIALVTLTLLLAGGLGWWYTHAAGRKGTTFRTAPVSRGNLRATISASGTLEPEDIVDVGAQVVGQIIALGDDPVLHKPIDYGSEVEPGTVLARIDDAVYKAKVEQSRAQLRSAQTMVDQAKAQESSAGSKL